MTWFFYVIETTDEHKSWYAGVTTDLLRRIRQHNGELAGGAKFTRGRRPVRLLFCWPYSSESRAKQVEARFKALPRNKKTYLVTYAHDVWERDGFGDDSND